MTEEASWTKALFATLCISTTHRDSARGYVCEVAGVTIRGGAVDETDCYESLINPGKPISREASVLHGVTNLLVTAAPRFWQQEPPLRYFLRGKTLVMHNALYTVPFLQRPMAHYRFTDVLDCRMLAVNLHSTPEGSSLQELIEYYGLEQELIYKCRVPRFNRSFFNALATAHVFVAMLREYFPQDITVDELKKICGVFPGRP